MKRMERKLWRPLLFPYFSVLFAHMQHHSKHILTSSDKIYSSLYFTLFYWTFYSTELTQLMKWGPISDALKSHVRVFT